MESDAKEDRWSGMVLEPSLALPYNLKTEHMLSVYLPQGRRRSPGQGRKGSSGVPGPWAMVSSLSRLWPTWGMRWMKPDIYSLEAVSSFLNLTLPAAGS